MPIFRISDTPWNQEPSIENAPTMGITALFYLNSITEEGLPSYEQIPEMALTLRVLPPEDERSAIVMGDDPNPYDWNTVVIPHNTDGQDIPIVFIGNGQVARVGYEVLFLQGEMWNNDWEYPDVNETTITPYNLLPPPTGH